MDIIHLLPDSVANQIAAGEVIQRPSSCLKELVENSLDAEATRITVIITDAGRTLLQVIDDGKGMSEKDALMAFERHATSKIAAASDLFSLRTMGFRGEALASICAVAHVEVQTRLKGDEVGTLLEIAGSNVIRQEVCACPEGTNFKVKDLFFNVPARRKFLKSDATELRNILQEFYRIVLVYPHVQFTLVHNDEVLADLTQGTYKQRIEQVFHKSIRTNFMQQFVDIQTETELVNIRGFVGKPEDASRQPLQYFFVNGRYMRHPFFHKAVMTAYSGMLPAEKTPSYFIYFDISPESIDVNIHPTKTEIKFADEQAIFQILLAAIRESLGKFDIKPTLDFTQEDITIDMPRMPKDVTNIPTPQVNINQQYNPFNQYSRKDYTPSNWQSLYEPPKTSQVIDPTLLDKELNFEQSKLTFDGLLQINNRHILYPTPEGLLIIDQHRAHLNILYEQYISEINLTTGLSQQLLFPETIDLSREESALLLQISDDLRAVGFDVEALGKTSFSINGVPPQLAEQNAMRVLMNILHNVQEFGKGAREQWHQQVALSLADDTAIPYGKHLSEDEMRDLVTKLFAMERNKRTPDGKLIAVLLTNEQINKLFK